MIFKNTTDSTLIEVSFTEADLVTVLAQRVPGMASLDETLMSIQPELVEGEYQGGGVKLIFDQSTQMGEDVP